MSDNTTNYKVYIEAGIMRYEFTHELSIENVSAAEKEAFGLIQSHHIRLIPTIVEFIDIDHDRVKVSISNLAKIISLNDIMKYGSGLWFVGAEGQVKAIAQMLNVTFLGSRAHLVATLDEAKIAAEKNKSVDVPLLEQ